MNGKSKCKILKEIRRRIAEENGIEYAVSECKHKGDCRGTCPKCESEVRYLESELEKRRAAGTKVAIASLALSVTLLNGCVGYDDGAGAGGDDSSVNTSETTVERDGEMMPMGDVTETTDDLTDTLMGDIAYTDGEMTDELGGVPLPSDTELMGEYPDDTASENE